MHDLNKSLDDLARSIDRAEKKRSSTGSTEQIARTAVDYEQLARERAERELYAARYKEQLLASADEECIEEPLEDISPHDSATNEPDPQPRVTAIESETVEDIRPGTTRLLTIPGAVYRIPNRTDAPEADSSYRSMSVLDEPAELDSYTAQIDYGRAYGADDAGAYIAPMEYEVNEPVELEGYPDETPRDPALEAEEYERFLAEHEQKGISLRKEKRLASENDEATVYFPTDSVDKSVKLVEARMLYEIETMKSKHRMLGYTFSMDVLKKDSTDRKMRRQISDRMYKLSRALKRERADATRYYMAALDKYPGNPDKRTKNSARIESILGRIDYTLKERERIDERLMRLYEEGTPNAAAIKQTKVTEKAAKAAYKSHLKMARRVARMHAPSELKEKIFELMNERVALLSNIERNAYLLAKKHYTGADKRAVKRQNKEMKRIARLKEDDIHFFYKKAERHNEERGAGMVQIGWVVGTVLVFGLIGLLYLLAKYYWRLF